MGHKIELKNSTSKGVQQTELVMKSKTNVTNILSEGEQKAVSIALFLAEIFVAQNKSSIILDDPVNSLDHKMMDCLSDILLQLDNQVIIFTHNIVYYEIHTRQSFDCPYVASLSAYDPALHFIIRQIDHRQCAFRNMIGRAPLYCAGQYFLRVSVGFFSRSGLYLGPLGERFVEPQVIPPLHRHQVAEPHV